MSSESAMVEKAAGRLQTPSKRAEAAPSAFLYVCPRRACGDATLDITIVFHFRKQQRKTTTTNPTNLSSELFNKKKKNHIIPTSRLFSFVCQLGDPYISPRRAPRPMLVGYGPDIRQGF